MHTSNHDRMRTGILLPAVALLLMTLACNIAERPEGRTDEITGEFYYEYSHLDRLLDTLADADGCDRDAARRELLGAHQYCQAGGSSYEVYVACMEDKEDDYRRAVMRACATPTIRPFEDAEPPPETDGSLTLLGFESELVQCDSSPSGHYYALECSFSVTVDLAYEIPATPAYAFCKVSTLRGGGYSSVELSDLQGELTLTMELGGIARLFENGESPVAGVDGNYANLSCFLGEFDGVETGAWDSFYCRQPHVEEKDCEGPWLDMSGG